MNTPSDLYPPPRPRLDLLSTQLKRSLLLNLQRYSAGLELNASLWVSGHALTQSSAYITEEKGIRLQENSVSMTEDYGDYTLAVGRTTFTIMANEIERLLGFFASQNIAVEVFKL